MKQLKLALIGFGSAGRAFAKMLLEKKKDLESIYDREIIVTAIVTASRGTLINYNGIDLDKACNDIIKHGRFDTQHDDYCNLTTTEVIENANYDVMCELTPLNIKTGQPATDHILSAIRRHKHVITANKGPVAWHYNEISKAAKDAGVMFFFETTVMDGTPVFNLVEHTLKLCKIVEIKGILNSTTNYILEEMEKGTAYAQIIANGRRRGFIEADMSMDINGYDAAAKLIVLMNVFMNANLTPDDVKRIGIEHINIDDIEAACARNKKIKLVCRGLKTEDGFEAYVEPESINRDEMYATVDSTTSVVSLKTDLMGTISIVEHQPEIEQTAYGIFSDMLRVLNGLS